MSISPLLASPGSSLSSLFDSSLDSQLVASVTPTSTDPSSISSLTSTALGASNTGLSGVASDLASLFKDLASNNTTAAQSDVTQLQKDLGTSATLTSATPSPLEKLLTSLSSSLTNGDTAGALQSLASFFLQSDSPNGNLVNTTA